MESIRANLTIDDRNKLDRYCDKFEAVCNNGVLPDIGEYVMQVSPSLRLALFCELIFYDLEFRWRLADERARNDQTDYYNTNQELDSTNPAKLDERPHLEDYLKAWPIVPPDKFPVELIEHEFLVRHRWGDRPKIDEYLRRFPSVSQLQELLHSRLQSTIAATTTTPQESECGSMRSGEEFGRYLINRLLGRGGMGVVYEAVHIPTRRMVALKVLNQKFQSPTHRRRFLREGRLAAAIAHRNAVYVFSVEEIDGFPVLSMELVGGGTLADRVKDNGPLPIREAIDHMLDLISGLEAAARVNILHRDIKPSNCFLEADGTTKIGDFGLSISTSPSMESFQTESGVFLGTPAFASPEQLRGNELDVRSDIYSVGVTLFYLLTGQAPFNANQMVQLMTMVLEQPAPTPCKIRSDIPRGLGRLISRCMEKQANKRFNSYSELRESLLRYSSTPTPAPLGIRTFAGCVDEISFYLTMQALALFLAEDPNGRVIESLTLEIYVHPWSAIGLSTFFCYYAISEGLWGKTIGKSIFGLCVVNSDEERLSAAAAAVRAGIFCLGFAAGFVFRGLISMPDGILWEVASFAPYPLLFFTMRRRNGFSGVHCLVTGTKVVQSKPQRKTEQFPSVTPATQRVDEPVRLGPYDVKGRIGVDVFLGHDPLLRRDVWLHIPGQADDLDRDRLYRKTNDIRYGG